jgi:DNA-directed RNA polymerase subunit E'
MYVKVRREDVVRMPPERLDEDMDELLKELTRSSLEGRIDSDKNLILVTSDIEKVGEGIIVHGDGAVYQKVSFDAIVFKPILQEVVEGEVCEVHQPDYG